MAIKLNDGGGDPYAPMSEINVTPFVDVMLVLLIVFIVTAPLLAVGVDVDLPQAEAPALPSQDVPLVISVDRDANVYIGDEQVAPADLIDRLSGIVGEDENRRIFVRGDQTVTYGRIMEVMGLIIQSGFTHVSLVAELPQDR
ncbi:MAG: ExbD/TolR family protein [Alphaproteobacteria bacterium]